MKLTDVDVDGFGVWSGLKVRDLSEVSVLYGPNEAGKTTLLEFVRSVFYGFSPERRGRYLPPLGDGRPGGSLGCVVDGDTCTLGRYLDGDDEIIELAVEGEDRPLEPQGLKRLLGDIDEPTFRHVFAFGLKEIQELGSLTDTKAGQLLYELSLGVDRVSLLEIMRELSASRNRLLASDQRPSLIVQLVGQHERLQTEISELGDLTPRYLALVEQDRQLETEIALTERDRAAVDQRARLHQAALAVSVPWQQRSELEKRLADLSKHDTLPEGVVKRYDETKTRFKTQYTRLKKLKGRQRKLRSEVARLDVNEPLCRHRARVEALGEQQPWMEALVAQVRALEESLAEAELQLEADQKQWPKSHAATSGLPSRSARAGLAEHARAVKAASSKLRSCKAALERGQQASDSAGERLTAQLDGGSPARVLKDLEQAGQLVTRLRRRVQLEERVDQLARQEEELEQQTYAWMDRQMLPTPVLAGLGGLFVLGCTLMLGGLLLPPSIIGSLGWAMAVLGVGGTASAGLTKLFMEKSAARQLETSQNRLSQVLDQLRAGRNETAALDEELPRGGGALVSRLQTAEQELARLEGLLPLENQMQEGQRAAGVAKADLKAAGAELAAARKTWQAALREAGLPDDLRPRQVREFYETAKRVAATNRRLEEIRRELADRRREQAMLDGRIAQLTADVGLAKISGEPLAQLKHLLGELGQQQSRLTARDELRKRLGKLSRRMRLIKHSMRKLRRGCEMLLDRAGAEDEPELRRRAEDHAQLERLKKDREDVGLRILALLGTQHSEEEIGDYLGGGPLAERGAQIEAELAQVVQRLDDRRQQRTRISNQMREVASDRKLSVRQLELSAVEQRLKEAMHRWQLLATAGLVLEQVRQHYEREHQPLALREASKYLRSLSDGRYTRVWAPLDEETLRVDDVEGKSLDVELLSRGTREQLFLSLRLALVSCYARKGIELPLVLDDVLVNFDDARAKAAAAALRDFARMGHQLLIFTCHEHIARLFRSLKVDVRQLPAGYEGVTLGRSTEEEARPRRSRIAATASAAPPPAAEPPADEQITAIVQPPEVEQPAQEVTAPQAEEPVAPTPVRRKRRRPSVRTRATVEQVPWSAEEFEGELVDRVRRVETYESEEPGDAGDSGEEPGAPTMRGDDFAAA